MGKPNNERLEFLGDRVLGLVIADELLRLNPKATEGEIASFFNALVKKETCSKLAVEMGLEKSLIIGKSIYKNNQRQKVKMLGDAIEALIGAIYLDAGFKNARDVVLKIWKNQIQFVRSLETHAKTALQEWLQAQGLPPPIYREISRLGPDHEPKFRVEVVLSSGDKAIGDGSTKRDAETKSAEIVLKNIKMLDDTK
jgi:ribonuclease-3